MRNTIAVIVRLLVDEDEPGALRGVLREVRTGQEHPFAGEAGLLALLWSFAVCPPVASAPEDPNATAASGG